MFWVSIGCPASVGVNQSGGRGRFGAAAPFVLPSRLTSSPSRERWQSPNIAVLPSAVRSVGFRGSGWYILPSEGINAKFRPFPWLCSVYLCLLFVVSLPPPHRWGCRAVLPSLRVCLIAETSGEGQTVSPAGVGVPVRVCVRSPAVEVGASCFGRGVLPFALSLSAAVGLLRLSRFAKIVRRYFRRKPAKNLSIPKNKISLSAALSCAYAPRRKAR